VRKKCDMKQQSGEVLFGGGAGSDLLCEGEGTGNSKMDCRREKGDRADGGEEVSVKSIDSDGTGVVATFVMGAATHVR
jgi:hypothetical protein